MNKKISLDIENFSIIEDYSDEQLALMNIYVCHDGNNKHNMPIDLKILKKAKKTLKNKFLLAGFDGFDFEGHEKDEKIVGFFPENSKMFFEEKDGKNYLVAQAILSKIYAKWAYDILLNNNKSVSMEITVLETEEIDGLEHIKSFVFNGVTLLGDSHMPACEGSSASIIKFSQENAQLKYNLYFSDSANVKKKFVEGMKSTEISRKEDKDYMEKEKINEEEVEELESTIPEESDDTTLMESVDEEKEIKEEKFEEDSLTTDQKMEIFRTSIKENISTDAWVETYDDEYIYVYFYNESKIFRIKYTLSGTEVELDMENKERVMRGGYITFSEEDENNKKEDKDDEKEEKEEDMSCDEEKETLKAENLELKNKIEKYENDIKSNSVEAILCEMIDVFSSEDLDNLREESKNFSLEELSSFENVVKAKAFEHIKETTKNKKDFSVNKIAINQEITKPEEKYGW